jgi:hypothetical protein
MKKSQLRSIIRGVIKETHPNHSPSQNHTCVGRMVAAHKCDTNGSGPGGSFVGGYNYGLPPQCMTIDGQTPQPGDLFKIKSTTPSYDCSTGNPGSGWNYGSNSLVTVGTNIYKVTYTFPCYTDYTGNSIPNDYYDFESATCCGIEGCTNPLATNYNPSAQCDDGSCQLRAYNPLEPADPITDKCKKCCCEPDEGGRCIEGTEISLVQDTNPCKCSPGMIDIPCK